MIVVVWLNAAAVRLDACCRNRFRENWRSWEFCGFGEAPAAMEAGVHSSRT